MSNNWERKKLGDLVDIKHGFAFPGTGITSIKSKNLLVTPGNFEVGGGFRLGRNKYFIGEVKEEYILSKNEIIVSMTDLSKEGDTLGYTAKIPDDSSYQYLHNQRIGKLVPLNKDFHIDFIYWLMRSRNYRHWILSSATGSMVKHTSPGRIKDYEFSLPPLSKQKTIANLLNNLDQKIELNKSLCKNLEDVAKVIFKSWFVDFDPIRSKLEDYSYKLPNTINDLFPRSFQDTKYGKIPSGWQLKSIFECGSFINGGAFSQKLLNYDQKGLPIIKINELNNGLTKQTNYWNIEFDEKYFIKRGDLLFSWSGNPDTSIGTYIWNNIDGLLNQHIFKVIPNNDFSRSHLLLLLKHYQRLFIELARNKMTTNLGHVTLQDLKENYVPYPDEKTLKAFSQITTPLIKRCINLNLEVQTISSIQKYILPKLISGELKISNTEKMLEEARI